VTDANGEVANVVEAVGVDAMSAALDGTATDPSGSRWFIVRLPSGQPPLARGDLAEPVDRSLSNPSHFLPSPGQTV
jgi:hypothetical protein